MIFHSWRAAVTDDVQNPGPDSDIFIIDEFENSFPEDFDVLKHFAWAKLLNSFQSDIIIFAVSVFEDHFNVFSVPALVDDITFVDVDFVIVLLLIVVTLLRHQIIFIALIFRWQIKQKLIL